MGRGAQKVPLLVGREELFDFQVLIRGVTWGEGSGRGLLHHEWVGRIRGHCNNPHKREAGQDQEQEGVLTGKSCQGQTQKLARKVGESEGKPWKPKEAVRQ